jgi:hypothetical protein
MSASRLTKGQSPVLVAAAHLYRLELAVGCQANLNHPPDHQRTHLDSSQVPDRKAFQR